MSSLVNTDPRQKTPNAIFIVGPSSSGKTTLCNAIAAEMHLDPARHIKEVARNVMRTQGFSRHTIQAYEMQHAIMLAQLEEEKRVLSLPPDATSQVQLLSDRSAVDPIIYALTSSPSEHMRAKLLHEPGFISALPIYRQSLFVLLLSIPEWIEDDGVRSLDDPSGYSAKLCGVLKELGIAFVEIDEDLRDLTQRVEFVKHHLSAMR